MDQGFNDRVDKIFGSVSSSSSSTPWSLTDAQLERREWNRPNRDDDDDQTPVSSSFQTKILDDDGENDWDIRSSIGLDSTLDNEEEEDAYDKIAEGKENYGDRLYMKDVTDHGSYLNPYNVLPRSVDDVKKDPRANHDAAKTRMKEDDDVVEGSDEPMLNAEASQDSVTTIKSILKRKSCDEVSKPAKRVRFHSTCKDVEATNPDLPENGCGVPDYILNPSKYTRYTFDDCVNDGSNNEEVLEQKSCNELPKSVVFIPRKKKDDGGCNGEEHVKQSPTQAGSTVGIAAVEVQQGEVSEMQEDDNCTKARCKKPVRQYRSKMDEYDDVS